MPRPLPPPTSPQLGRLLTLLDWLRAGRPFTAREAGGALGVTTRTVGHDLERLRALGADVAYDARAGTYRLGDDAATLPAPVLSRADFAALLVARHALDALGDGPDAALLDAVAGRIAAHLPETVRVASGAFAGAVRYRSGPETERPAVALPLHEAAVARRVVRLRYHAASTDAETGRDVEPRGVVHRDGRWYVVGWCRLRADWRDFRLDRVRAVDVLDEGAPERAYEGAPFDLDRYLAGAFGMVRGAPAVHVHLRFSARQARWVREERWHPTQRLTPLDDGRLDLELDATGLDDLVRWVLSYGGEVRVLAPAALRDRVVAEARRIVAAADDPGAP